MKSYIIGIAGESGVGKSTIAEIVSLFFGKDNTIAISTDDLHKWERTNPMWEKITHLNPDANNLELGDIHVSELSQGKFIYRSVYSHKHGYFDPPQKIEPKAVVIVEGLHSFYTDSSRELIDLKIFVDTDEDLRVHWKIIRDTEERGYTYNTALQAINKRRADSEKVRQAQIEIADVIIRLTPEKKITHIGDRSEVINLVTEVTCRKEGRKDLIDFIQAHITEFNRFVLASEMVGHNLDLVQDGGGNISVKISDDLMIIKSSGFRLKDVYRLNGYSLVNYKLFSGAVEDNFDQLLTDCLVSDKYRRPSMETGFHSVLRKYVIHVHPVYLTVLLCLKQSRVAIAELFPDLDYEYIPYAHPGFALYDAIKSSDLTKKVFFLENHGVIISTDCNKEALDLLATLNKTVETYLRKSKHWNEFDISYADLEANKTHYLFPDAAIFLHDDTKIETRAAHNYVELFCLGLDEARYITHEDVHHLKNLEAEKYRKTI